MKTLIFNKQNYLTSTINAKYYKIETPSPLGDRGSLPKPASSTEGLLRVVRKYIVCLSLFSFRRELTTNVPTHLSLRGAFSPPALPRRRHLYTIPISKHLFRWLPHSLGGQPLTRMICKRIYPNHEEGVSCYAAVNILSRVADNLLFDRGVCGSA